MSRLDEILPEPSTEGKAAVVYRRAFGAKALGFMLWRDLIEWSPSHNLVPTLALGEFKALEASRFWDDASLKVLIGEHKVSPSDLAVEDLHKIAYSLSIGNYP